jgi:hypothetical protein
MDHKDFPKYIEILKQEPFRIYPPPQGPDQTILWHSRKFVYVDYSPTHIIIQDAETQKSYDLPLVLVEFANRGVLRLTRSISPWNGSFV